MGFALNFILSNMEFQKKQLGVPTTEELEAIDRKRDEEIRRMAIERTAEAWKEE